MIIVLYSFNFRSAPGTYCHRNISGRKEIIRATSYDHSVSSCKLNVWFWLGKRTSSAQTLLWSCLKLSKYVISQPDWSEYAQKIWSQRRDSIERLLAASGWMKPAGTSCNIPIGQNLPKWQGCVATISFLPGLGPMTLCCADHHVLVVASLLVVPLHSATGPRILVRPALVLECRIAARTAMVSRPPPRLAHCPI